MGSQLIHKYKAAINQEARARVCLLKEDPDVCDTLVLVCERTRVCGFKGEKGEEYIEST